MKIVLTAGGTAGHINPALALAEELVTRGNDVIFAGTPNRLEAKLVPDAGYEFVGFSAKGFNRKKLWTLFTALNSIKKGTKTAKEWLKNENADVVVGFGCYVSMAICRAAFQLKIPYIIHEQNSVMGMANKYLSKNAHKVCLAYNRAIPGKVNNVEVVGNPVRKSVFEATKDEGRHLLNIPNSAKMLLVFGGSLGAKILNNSIVAMADSLLEEKNLYIVHITGNKQYKSVKGNLHLDINKLKRYIVLPYQNKMGQTLAAADMCICRAGASTIAELTAKALPSLLVPYPYATENHQFYNAQTLLNAGCAMFINDSAVGSKEFNDAVVKLIKDDNMREDMKDSFKQFDAKHVAEKFADIVLSCA